eukprot:Plantae.Rhodophyta-Palmaria_palmata.ctg27014.p1 GENE.Plantae.Rhodophyta-Palmaria_palmata.ctg27014~~Plantae.Rhodophyta-Palmaria_palmata.ctg27014.p1  ORF type:complete len:134 (+),score=11.74 Plantae.Rhodophyta-Palmaria_palmata.ctg27014:41-403(+)
MVAFRTGVFNAGVPVRPVCIRFPYKNFNLSWESIRFWEHLYRTMTQWRNCVDLVEMPPYIPSEDEKSDARLFFEKCAGPNGSRPRPARRPAKQEAQVLVPQLAHRESDGRKGSRGRGEKA